MVDRVINQQYFVTVLDIMLFIFYLYSVCNILLLLRYSLNSLIFSTNTTRSSLDILTYTVCGLVFSVSVSFPLPGSVYFSTKTFVHFICGF